MDADRFLVNPSCNCRTDPSRAFERQHRNRQHPYNQAHCSATSHSNNSPTSPGAAAHIGGPPAKTRTYVHTCLPARPHWHHWGHYRTGFPPSTTTQFLLQAHTRGGRKGFLVLKRHNMNLGLAIAAQQDLSLRYGSELKPPQILQHLFQHHLLWKWMETILINESQWPLM
jgi:hypothetical protein